jgi:hypothetical protein
MLEKDVLAQQHDRFRKLVQHLVQQTVEANGVKADDWLVQCYRSVEEFETQFPNAADREAMLTRIQTRFEANRKGWEAFESELGSLLDPFMF